MLNSNNKIKSFFFFILFIFDLIYYLFLIKEIEYVYGVIIYK